LTQAIAHGWNSTINEYSFMPKDLGDDNCKVLLVKVVWQARRDALGGTTSDCTLDDVVDAARWILSDRTSTLSYLWICSILGLSPSHLRELVLRRLEGETL
jgi:hypothetical protein